MSTTDDPHSGATTPMLAPLCDNPSQLHPTAQRPPAEVVVVVTAGPMKRMLLCEHCVTSYLIQAAGLIMADHALGNRDPVAIMLLPLPKLPIPDLVSLTSHRRRTRRGR